MARFLVWDATDMGERWWEHPLHDLATRSKGGSTGGKHYEILPAKTVAEAEGFERRLGERFVSWYSSREKASAKLDELLKAASAAWRVAPAQRAYRIAEAAQLLVRKRSATDAPLETRLALFASLATFRARFKSFEASDSHTERAGQRFTVIDAVIQQQGRDKQLPLYVIEFADGHRMEAWPDEVIDFDAVADMRSAIAEVQRATEGDSNDSEIELLQVALSTALSRWPEVK